MIWCMTLTGSEAESSAISAHHCALLARTRGELLYDEAIGKNSRGRPETRALEAAAARWVRLDHESYRTTPLLAASE